MASPISMRPRAGRVKPAMASSSAVLPAPAGPCRAVMPSGSGKSISSPGSCDARVGHKAVGDAPLHPHAQERHRRRRPPPRASPGAARRARKCAIPSSPGCAPHCRNRGSTPPCGGACPARSPAMPPIRPRPRRPATGTTGRNSSHARITTGVAHSSASAARDAFCATPRRVAMRYASHTPRATAPAVATAATCTPSHSGGAFSFIGTFNYSGRRRALKWRRKGGASRISIPRISALRAFTSRIASTT